ncbi:MAG: hypothetical protein KBT02_13480 [Treponema sp.]|nr:hypothetical protein [Candidatus Treponema caballi]
MAQINTDEERARLDEIFAQVEQELYYADHPEEKPQVKTQKETDAENFERSVSAQTNQSPEQIVGNIRQYIRNDCWKTKREKVLGLAYLKLYEEEIQSFKAQRGQIRAELECYRNFVKAVSTKLENAERTAKEQDNHHYYKIFADSVKKLIDNL